MTKLVSTLIIVGGYQYDEADVSTLIIVGGYV